MLTPLETFRRSQKLSQQQLATALGLHSKGYISRIERGRPIPVKLALEIERLTNGAVAAVGLVTAEDADLLRDFLARAAGGHILATASSVGRA